MIDNRFFNNQICKLGTFEVSNGRASAMQDKATDIDFSIAKYEPEYLRMLMGSEVYEEYKSTINDTKWTPLVSRLVDDVNFISPIANYVYCKHKYNSYIESNGKLDYITKADNMTVISPTERYKIAWNDMVDMNNILFDWIYKNILISDIPAIETTAQWDTSYWEFLTTYESGTGI
jgi:hypothetical protein